ncbi:hypothetical protein [Mycolicibacterium austroafricanum]|uniref:hypothetical protein n=1 Tax=Mycolicibacterium austroafricanum TaxID=39687 RepID=UPI000A9E6B36|nr:hypothetical protein [Mycolicibacterium austroafricanum]
MSVFYELPATELVEGLSTDDAQRILDVMRVGEAIQVTVYTPRPDDDAQDRQNQEESETRLFGVGSYVSLGAFPGTPVDLSRHPQARNRRESSR